MSQTQSVARRTFRGIEETRQWAIGRFALSFARRGSRWRRKRRRAGLRRLEGRLDELFDLVESLAGLPVIRSGDFAEPFLRAREPSALCSQTLHARALDGL